jgi:pilus assembly protein Flp/PilA
MLQYVVILLTHRCRTERGASAVEYGLLVAGVAAALIFTGWALGETVGAVFKHENDQLQAP